MNYDDFLMIRMSGNASLTFLLMYVYNISPGHKLMYVLDVVM